MVMAHSDSFLEWSWVARALRELRKALPEASPMTKRAMHESLLEQNASAKDKA